MRKKDEYRSLTDLGKMFGVSNQECGQWLADLGLRIVGGDPTAKAFQLGLVTQVPTGRGIGGYYYIWHTSKTVALLLEAGHRPAGMPDSPDGESAIANQTPTGKVMVGPFEFVQSGDGWLIRNGDGATVFWAFDEEAADFGSRLLTLAYKHGIGPFGEGANQ